MPSKHKFHRRRLIVALMTAWALPATVTADGPVEDYGDPAKMIISGAKSYSEDEIRDELFKDFDVILAAHPSAPLADFPKIVEQRLVAGYNHNGFPDAAVAVVLDQGNEQIRVAIHEGPQFQKGKVRIVGSQQIDSDQLRQRLTEKFPPSDSVAASFGSDERTRTKWVDQNGKDVELEGPVWNRKSPAPFDLPTHEKLHQDIKQALRDIGFEFAEFSIDVERNRNGPTADLIVRLIDEGAPSVIQKIAIIGNKKNTRDEILKFLNIKTGMVLSRVLRTAISKRLWDSGRFAEIKVKTESAPSNDGIVLDIRVAEYDQAPPLGQSFSANEQVLLKCRDWLNSFNEQEYDLVVQIQFMKRWFEFVISPETGVCLGFRKDNDPQNPFVYWAVMSPESIAVYSSVQQRKYVTPPLRAKVSMNIGLFLADAADWERKFRMTFGLGTSSHNDDGPPPPFRLATRLAPAHFVALAHEDNPKFEWTDEVVIRTIDNVKSTIDIKTGRLVSYEDIHDDKEQGRMILRLSTRKDFYKQRISEVKLASKDYVNEYDSDRPLGSTIAFLLSDDFLWRLVESNLKKDEQRDFANQYRRLLSELARQGILKPIDDWFKSPRKRNSGKFSLNSSKELRGVNRNYTSLFAIGVMQEIDHVFPRRSWPWTISREAAFVVLKKPKYVSRELKRVYEDAESGPICHLVVARLLSLVNNAGSKVFAKRGIERLVLSDFQNDFDLLLSKQCLFGQFVEQFGEVVRGLDDEQIALLGKLMFSADQEKFHSAIRLLQRNRNMTVMQVMPEVLTQLWDAGIRNHVEWALQDQLNR